MSQPLRRRATVAIACILAGALWGGAWCAEEGEVKGAESLLQASSQDMAWWREGRFGLFVHWGPVSLRGTEIGWSRGGERRGTGGTGQIPAQVYDNLYKQFNPVEFDAAEWVRIAKAAGMKYIVFTTKHHDGFSMFGTQLSDYNITRSSFGRDIVAELAQACHEAGIGLGFYYSPPDWHHPDYRTDRHAAYVKYLHGQLRELCTNYGKIDIIWFDGLGGTAQDWDSERLLTMIRKLQPHVLINNRAGLRGDFDTPEQRVGRFQPDRPWESCITICRQWAWKPDDRLKSLQECVHTLVRCACGDGNLLLNVGPMPTGSIEPRQVERLAQIGRWLQAHGETIYGTRGGPFRTARWGGTTYEGDRIFAHILQQPEGALRLPPIDGKIIATRVLTGGTVDLRQTDDSIELYVAQESRDPLDTIVELRLDRPAGDVRVGVLPSGSVALGKPTFATNTYRGMDLHGPGKALDDDPDTRWATDYGVHQAQLWVDLGEDSTVGRAYLSEAYDRVRSYRLEYWDGESWQALARGDRIGEDKALTFSPVTTRHIRLNILDATEGPTIWELQLLGPED